MTDPIDTSDADTPLAFSDKAYVWWMRMEDGSFAFAIVDPEPPQDEP